MLELKTFADDLAVFLLQFLWKPIMGLDLNLIDEERKHIDDAGGRADLQNPVVVLLDQVIELCFLLLDKLESLILGLRHFHIFPLWHMKIVLHDMVLQLLEGVSEKLFQLLIEASVEDLDELAQMLIVLLVVFAYVDLGQVGPDHFFQNDVRKGFVRGVFGAQQGLEALLGLGLDYHFVSLVELKHHADDLRFDFDHEVIKLRLKITLVEPLMLQGRGHIVEELPFAHLEELQEFGMDHDLAEDIEALDD